MLIKNKIDLNNLKKEDLKIITKEYLHNLDVKDVIKLADYFFELGKSEFEEFTKITTYDLSLIKKILTNNADFFINKLESNIKNPLMNDKNREFDLFFNLEILFNKCINKLPKEKRKINEKKFKKQINNLKEMKRTRNCSVEKNLALILREFCWKRDKPKSMFIQFEKTNN